MTHAEWRHHLVPRTKVRIRWIIPGFFVRRLAVAEQRPGRALRSAATRRRGTSGGYGAVGLMLGPGPVEEQSNSGVMTHAMRQEHLLACRPQYRCHDHTNGYRQGHADRPADDSGGRGYAVGEPPRPLSSHGLIDGARWRTLDPPIRDSIAECEQGEVFIWNRELSPTLPIVHSPGGGIEGPKSGPVIQYNRCVMEDDELLSGRIAAGFLSTDTDRAAYIDPVWKLVKASTGPVEGLTGVRFDHRLGRDALRWYQEDRGPNWARAHHGHCLRDRAVTALYLRPRQVQTRRPGS